MSPVDSKKESGMNRWQAIAGIGLCLGLAGCAGTSRNTLYQTSTIDALLAGTYDGDMSLNQLRRQGDFGIGTYDNLDGEMVLLDGPFYQVKADGKVYAPDLRGETPFAAVCPFRPETEDCATVDLAKDRQPDLHAGVEKEMAE